MNMQTSVLPSRQQGLSLIELMIAMAVGIFILLGVVMVYVSGARTSATTEAISRVQESGRFAQHFLAQDIRQAGFKSACQNEVNNLLDETHAAYDDRLFDLDDPIEGWDGAGALSAKIPNYVRGDTLILKSSASLAGITAKNVTQVQAAAITLNAASGIEKGTIMMIADAQGCDIFQKGNNANAKSVQRPASGSPGNKSPSNRWSHEYDETLEIMTFSSALYYIGTGADGRAALRRVSFHTGTVGVDEELVNGIDDMQLLYGVDDDGDRSVDRFITATQVNADLNIGWDEVLAVQVSLLASSFSGNVINQVQVLPVPYNGFADPDDGRLRRVFTNTVGIRSRVP